MVQTEQESGVSGQGSEDTPQPLPVFVCHKKVQAVKILSRGMDGESQHVLYPAADLDPIPVTVEWLEKHVPKVGGYFVRYADGYESYSPAEAFEDGYTLEGAAEDEETSATEVASPPGIQIGEVRLEVRVSNGSPVYNQRGARTAENWFLRDDRFECYTRRYVHDARPEQAKDGIYPLALVRTELPDIQAGPGGGQVRVILVTVDEYAAAEAAHAERKAAIIAHEQEQRAVAKALEEQAAQAKDLAVKVAGGEISPRAVPAFGSRALAGLTKKLAGAGK